MQATANKLTLFSILIVASGSCMLGEVKLMAGSRYTTDMRPADGRLLPINQYQSLFSLLGTEYGGDGRTTFALPDLTGAEPRGEGPRGEHYTVCVQGLFP